MARIRTYPTDTVLTDGDRLLGTDGDSGQITSNFTLGELKEFVASGIDITQHVPPNFIPAVNAAQDDAINSNIGIEIVQRVDDISFFNQASEEENSQNEIQSLTFDADYDGASGLEFTIQPPNGHGHTFTDLDVTPRTQDQLADYLIAQWNDVDFDQGWIASAGENPGQVLFTQEQMGDISGLFDYNVTQINAVAEQVQFQVQSGSDQAIDIDVTTPELVSISVTALAAVRTTEEMVTLITDEFNAAAPGLSAPWLAVAEGDIITFTKNETGVSPGDFVYSVEPVAAVTEVQTMQFTEGFSSDYYITITTPAEDGAGGNAFNISQTTDAVYTNSQIASHVATQWNALSDNDDWTAAPGLNGVVRFTKDTPGIVNGTFAYDIDNVDAVTEVWDVNVSGSITGDYTVTVVTPEGSSNAFAIDVDPDTTVSNADDIVLAVRNAFQALDTADDDNWNATIDTDNNTLLQFVNKTAGDVSGSFTVTLTAGTGATFGVSLATNGVDEQTGPLNDDVTIAIETEGINATNAGPAPDDVEISITREGADDIIRGPGNTQVTIEVEEDGLDVESDATETGRGQFILYNNGDGWWLQVHDYRGQYSLPSLAGKTFEAVATDEDIAITGIIGEHLQVNDKDYYLDSDGDYAIRFEIEERTGDLAASWDLLPNASNIAHEFRILAADNDNLTLEQIIVHLNSELSINNLQVNGTFEVDGRSQFNDTVTIGTQDPDNPTELFIHGTQTFTRESDGIVFGEPPAVALTYDGEGLSFDGAGGIDIRNNVEFTHPEGVDVSPGPIRVTNEVTGQVSSLHSGGITISDSEDIVPVVGNPADDGQVENLLTRLQIGDDYFFIPSAADNVAEFLPGVNEVLGVAPVDFTVGRFFYADEIGSTAEWASNITFSPSADIDVTTGENNFVIASSQRAAFQTLRDNRVDGQQLFFISEAQESDFDLDAASPGDTVTGVNVYEVVNYDEDSGNVRFGVLGGGTLHIGTGDVVIDGIPFDPGIENEEIFLVIDDSTRELYGRTIENAGFIRGISYFSSSLNTQQGVGSITFAGNDRNIDLSGGAAPVIDISGRYVTRTANVPHVLGDGDDPTLIPFGYYVLDTITTAQSLTLPEGNPGDSIKFSNVSLFNEDGDAVDSQTWTLEPFSGDAILKQVDEPLVLDLEAQNFELVFVGGTVGWVIN